MGIYRGPGGTGDATQDASSQAVITVTAKDAALVAQAAAELSASNASTSATNAAASASSVSAAATTATTKASEASTSASNAATSEANALSYKNTAVTSASTATTQATNAAASASSATTSASTATTQAANASTSATNAANSATSAATSATNAAASYDSFDDRYLGPKASAPTLDNDGNALLTGALYFNTSSNTMKVWNGSSWSDAYASLSGALIATNNLSDLNSTSTARTNLGVAIGSNVQAWDADLDAIAAIAATSGLLKKTAANTWSLDTSTYLTSAVTSVTGTSPIVSSGGNTPAISIPAATTSVNGYLTSTDWTTFNGKQAALVSGTNIKTVNSTSLLGTGDVSVGVTSVTGTAPVVSSGGAAPAISMAAATASVNGYMTSTYASKLDGITAGATNTTLVAGTGISVSGSTGAVTITNTATSPYVGERGQVFTSSGTFTIPTGVTALKITVVGGGGGGGGSGDAGWTSIGGTGSGVAISYLTGLTPAATLAVTIGGGGTAGAAGRTNGGTGGNSTVASGTQTISTITGGGGGGGYWISQCCGNGSTAKSGGIGSGGTLNMRGSGTFIPYNGYASALVGAGSFLSGNAVLQWVYGTNIAGIAGNPYGGGGTGAYNFNANQAGGAGAAGVVIFEW
jgi:hypothetical protein